MNDLHCPLSSLLLPSVTLLVQLIWCPHLYYLSIVVLVCLCFFFKNLVCGVSCGTVILSSVQTIKVFSSRVVPLPNACLMTRFLLQLLHYYSSPYSATAYSSSPSSLFYSSPTRTTTTTRLLQHCYLHPVPSIFANAVTTFTLWKPQQSIRQSNTTNQSSNRLSNRRGSSPGIASDYRLIDQSRGHARTPASATHRTPARHQSFNIKHEKLFPSAM